MALIQPSDEAQFSEAEKDFEASVLLVCSFVVVVVAVVVAVEVTERYDCIFLDFVTLIKLFLKLKIYRRPSGLFGTKIQQQH